MTRRANNEGSVYRMPNGKWRGAITIEGKRLTKVASTRKEVAEWVRKVLNQKDAGLTLKGVHTTLQEFLDGWLVNTRSQLRKNTWDHYAGIFRNYIYPALGPIKFKDLRPEHIQRLYNTLLSQGVGPYTVVKAHNALHKALDQAVDLGLTVRNPSDSVLVPKPIERELRIFDENEVNRLLVAAIGNRLYALYFLEVVTGVRQMELFGLQWPDLDWKRQTLSVQRQLLKGKKEEVLYGPIKTKYGNRVIALGKKTIEVLRAHHEHQQFERRLMGDRWQEHGLIFTNTIGGPLNPKNFIDREFKPLLKAAGLPEIRFHDLRHTAASLMLNQGVPVFVVSRRLGHSKASITLDLYGHLIPHFQHEAAEMIEEMIAPVEVMLK